MQEPTTGARPCAVLAMSAFVLSLSASSQADDHAAQREIALGLITPQLVKAHVQFLSHDLLEGRDTGERGYEIAREYVASQFVRMGAAPTPNGTHLQPFEVLVGGDDHGSRLSVGGITIESPEAAFAPDWTARAPVISGDGVFVGQGLVAEGRDDYRDKNGSVDVRGKIVFMVPGVPPDWEEHPTLGLLNRSKILIALKRGARAVVMLKPDSEDPRCTCLSNA